MPRDATSFVLRVFDCNSGRGLGQGSSFANHGTVTFKEGASRGCGQAHATTVFAYYTPNAGFVGQDDVTIYVGPSPYHMIINVGAAQVPASHVQTTRKVQRSQAPSTGGGSGGAK